MLNTVEFESIGSEEIQDNNEQDIVAEKLVSDHDKITDDISVEREAIIDEVKDEVKVDVGLSAWIVQLGSFTEEDNAQSLNEKLRKAGYPAFVEPLKKNGKISYRVRVGPEIRRSEADLLLKNLKDKMKLDGIVVTYP